MSSPARLGASATTRTCRGQTNRSAAMTCRVNSGRLYTIKATGTSNASASGSIGPYSPWRMLLAFADALHLWGAQGIDLAAEAAKIACLISTVCALRTDQGRIHLKLHVDVRL